MRYVLFICAAFLAASPAYAESECRLVPTALIGGLVQKNSSPRAEELFKEVVQRSGLKQEIIPVLCEFVSNLLLIPLATGWRSFGENGDTRFSYAVILSRRMVTELNDDEIRGLIAHEVGHIVQWSRDPVSFFRGALSSDELIKIEMDVDAIAARFVGRETVIKGLRAIEHLVAPHGDQPNIHRVVRERVKALLLLALPPQRNTLLQGAPRGALFSGKIPQIF